MEPQEPQIAKAILSKKNNMGDVILPPYIITKVQILTQGSVGVGRCVDQGDRIESLGNTHAYTVN